MKTNNIAINLLFFCYAFFSFAVFNPGEKINFFTWCTIIGLHALLYVFFVLLTVNNRKLKPLCSLLLLFYIIYLMGIQLYKMWDYMKLYHGQTSAASTLVITALIILIFAGMNNLNITSLYLPLITMIILLIGVVFCLNASKVSRYNICISDSYMPYKWNITLFDFIIPYIVALSLLGNKGKKNGVSFVLANAFALIGITLFAFMCVKGDLLYSLSPLQMLFQVSSTNLIRNFDALFNYLLYFSYFGALTALMHTYKSLKNNFNYFGHWDLLLIIPVLLLKKYFENIPLLLIEVIMITVLYFGREKKRYYEKNPD